MVRGTRAGERVYFGVMWAVSVILACFLIGLGSLVIGDLPRVSNPVMIDQFIDRAAQAPLRQEARSLDQAAADIQNRLNIAEQRLNSAQNDVESAQTTFNNWIATRTATSDRAQDPEVLRRTQALEALRNTEREAQQTRDNIAAEQQANADKQSANQAAQGRLAERALPLYERARFFQQLNVFLLRLAFTLPLLVIAGLFLLQKRKGDYWPVKRGFVLFAAFAFFVELAPYLPEYGGYVRYGVGVLVTLLAAHFLIRWMRRYLATRAAAEAQAEVERRKHIAYEEALKKMAARSCPGCERPLAAVDTPVDFCMHCGMQLFDHCPACDTRKFAFFRYCMKCGAPARTDEAAAPAR